MTGPSAREIVGYTVIQAISGALPPMRWHDRWYYGLTWRARALYHFAVYVGVGLVARFATRFARPS